MHASFVRRTTPGDSDAARNNASQGTDTSWRLPSDKERPAMHLTRRVNRLPAYLLGLTEQGAVMQGCYMRITPPIQLSNAFRLSI